MYYYIITINVFFYYRAIYKPADIYLLDDPLSAVDIHVGKQLFDICIKGNFEENFGLWHNNYNYDCLGYLKEKACILVTHQLQYLTKVDQIVLMENVSIIILWFVHFWVMIK